MNIIFICQAVDQNDTLLASTIGWIREFAQRPEIGKVTALALRVGEFDLPENVEVVKIKGANRLATTFNFYKEVLRRIKNTDWFFIYQGGHYPLLLLPFKLLGKKIYQWKAHPRVSLMMRFYAYVCDTKIFTSTPSAFPMKLKKVKVVGQGVDTEKFNIQNIPKTGDWVTVGRIAPVKRLEKAIELLAHYNKRYDVDYRLDIYGPVFLEKDRKYKRELDQLILRLGLEKLVEFKGAVNRDKLPEILNRYKLFISFNDGAVDRSVLEAAACGLPVFTPNKCVAEMDISSRGVIVKNYSLKVVIKRIFKEI
ncbi:MAG: glycosyltransferase [Patescibacteria group bacterium]